MSSSIPPQRSEKTLKYLLILVGVCSATAFFCVFLPYPWMNDTHRRLGMGTLPDVPIVGYLTRSLSALYAFVGGFFCLVATDVRRYRPMVRFIGLASIVFGVLIVGIDICEQMPLSWTVSEGPLAILYGCLVLWLSRFVSPYGNTNQS